MKPTRHSLPTKKRAAVADLLNQSLADLSDLYSQTKQAHWNVRGRQFYAFHKLFDDLAESVEGHLDDIAERVTALGGTARGTIRQAAAASRLPEFPSKLKGDQEFVAALVERYAQAANETREAIDAADELGDADSADLLTAASRDLDKALWMLEAHEVH
jgi:starvation-inducible DNA-binding protein